MVALLKLNILTYKKTQPRAAFLFQAKETSSHQFPHCDRRFVRRHNLQVRQ